MVLNLSRKCLTQISNEMSLIRPFLVSIAQGPLKDSLNKSVSLIQPEFAIELQRSLNWIVDANGKNMVVVNAADQTLNEDNANADYEQYQTFKARRLQAASKIKMALKSRKRVADKKNWSRVADELITHLNNEYYGRTGLTSLDVHYILEQVSRLTELQRRKACDRESIQTIADETSAWMADEGEKFEVR